MLFLIVPKSTARRLSKKRDVELTSARRVTTGFWITRQKLKIQQSLQSWQAQTWPATQSLWELSSKLHEREILVKTDSLEILLQHIIQVLTRVDKGLFDRLQIGGVKKFLSVSGVHGTQITPCQWFQIKLGLAYSLKSMRKQHRAISQMNLAIRRRLYNVQKIKQKDQFLKCVEFKKKCF